MPVSFDGPIADLVPHRATMLLVERVLAADAERITVETHVRREMPFVTEQGLPNWVGVELMAQTIAAWGGLKRRELGQAVQLGFLLGSRRYECELHAFPLGARLVIEATLELVAENALAVFACTLTCDGRAAARAHLNVFQPDDVERYLEGSVGS